MTDIKLDLSGLVKDWEQIEKKYRKALSKKTKKYNQEHSGEYYVSDTDVIMGMIVRDMVLANKKNDLADRLVLQYKIYLFQLLIANLGFGYVEDGYKPYSKDLENYISERYEFLQKISYRPLTFSEIIKENITFINKLEVYRQDLEPFEFYALCVALYHLSLSIKITDKETLRKELLSKLKKATHYWTEAEFLNAFTVLIETGIIKW